MFSIKTREGLRGRNNNRNRVVTHDSFCTEGSLLVHSTLPGTVKVLFSTLNGVPGRFGMPYPRMRISYHNLETYESQKIIRLAVIYSVCPKMVVFFSKYLRFSNSCDNSAITEGNLCIFIGRGYVFLMLSMYTYC